MKVGTSSCDEGPRFRIIRSAVATSPIRFTRIVTVDKISAHGPTYRADRWLSGLPVTLSLRNGVSGSPPRRLIHRIGAKWGHIRSERSVGRDRAVNGCWHRLVEARESDSWRIASAVIGPSDVALLTDAGQSQRECDHPTDVRYFWAWKGRGQASLQSRERSPLEMRAGERLSVQPR